MHLCDFFTCKYIDRKILEFEHENILYVFNTYKQIYIFIYKLHIYCVQIYIEYLNIYIYSISIINIYLLNKV